MTGKDTLIGWQEAVELHNKNSTSSSIEKFRELIDSNPAQGISKLHYNVGILSHTLGNSSQALNYMDSCIQKDPYNNMAHFQRGILLYKVGQFSAALEDFKKCISGMRQAIVIDYNQLWLKSKLYLFEVVYNEAACYQKFNDIPECIKSLKGLELIQKQQALQLQGQGSVNNADMDIPSAIESLKQQPGKLKLEIIERGGNVLYSPPSSIVRNFKKKKYIQDAVVISSEVEGDKFTGFVGPQKIRSSSSAEESLTSLDLPKKLPPERPSSPRPITPMIQRRDRPVPKLAQASTSSTPTLSKLAIEKPAVQLRNKSDIPPSLPPPRKVSGPATPSPPVAIPEPTAPPPRRPKVPQQTVSFSKTSEQAPSQTHKQAPVGRNIVSEMKQRFNAPGDISPLVSAGTSSVTKAITKDNNINNNNNNNNDDDTVKSPVPSSRQTLYTIDLVSGDRKKTITISPEQSDYSQVMERAGKLFKYNKDSYTLWYVNRLGSYTLIEDQGILEHVWKTKLIENRITLYVFGV